MSLTGKQMNDAIDPDEAMPHYQIPGLPGEGDIRIDLPGAGCFIIYTIDPNETVPEIWLPSNTSNPSGQMTKPPPVGYQVVVSPPTMSGCEYVTFTGKDSSGKDFAIAAQVYIFENTSTGEKAQEIATELEAQSNNNSKDPIKAEAKDGSLTVKADNGSTLTSAEWDNGSGEQDNELNEESIEQKKKTSATCVKGSPTGVSFDGDASFLMIGVDRFRIYTYVAKNECKFSILSRLKYGLTFLGIKAELGFDSESACWLVWVSDHDRCRFGSNDTGISHTIISSHEALSLKDMVKVGRYDISFD